MSSTQLCSSTKNIIKRNPSKLLEGLLETRAIGDKELAAATLHSIALNYSECKGRSPLKAILRAVSQLKKRSGMIITHCDKGSGVVVMKKSDCVCLLKESSINDELKFILIILERPRT